MVRLAEVGQGRDFICSFNIAVHMVQCFALPSWTCNVLMEIGEDGPHVYMIKVSCHNKNPIRVYRLKISNSF